VVRALTVATSLALAALALAVIALVATRSAVTSPWASMPAGAAARPVAARSGEPSGGRWSLEEAMRALDLVKPPTGRLADDFTVPTAAGQRFRLSDHRGKVVFLNFWATWCPPCREEMPALERLYRQQKDRGFTMVAISLDASPAVVGPYLAQGGFTFPVALDPRMELANAYAVRALPASFIVDPRGVVVAMALGAREWDGPAARALVAGAAR
jgi:peroxiredoxin